MNKTCFSFCNEYLFLFSFKNTNKYSFFSAEPESNQRPKDSKPIKLQSSALPSELSAGMGV